MMHGMGPGMGMMEECCPGMTAKRDVLEALAKLLIEKEVVDREALTPLLAGTMPA